MGLFHRGETVVSFRDLAVLYFSWYLLVLRRGKRGIAAMVQRPVWIQQELGVGALALQLPDILPSGSRSLSGMDESYQLPILIRVVIAEREKYPKLAFRGTALSRFTRSLNS